MSTCPTIIAAISESLCQPIDIYCERLGPGLWAEPFNALSNAAFFLAAIAVGNHKWPSPPHHTASLIKSLVAVIAVIGMGSLVFHTVATRWAVWGDVIPILIFMLLYLWLVLRGFFHWPGWLAAAAVLLFLVATLFLEAALPENIVIPSAMYFPALAALIATTLALIRSQWPAGRAMLLAVSVFAFSIALRSLDQPLCAINPIGTHFLWHLLNGLLLYLLLRLAILHLSRAPA